ncbi:MAG: glycosyltransferase [Chloroflexi bacterium]|nr:glycosyltransferase [Chloroflexota bacterium]
MQILVLSPFVPHPEILHAGGQHLYRLIHDVSPRHELHLLAYGRDESPEQIAAINALCGSVKIVTPAYTWGQKVEQVRQGGWRHPHTIGRRTHFEMRQAIRQICEYAKIDVAHLAWTEMARYLEVIPPQIGTVVNLLDIEARVRPRELALYPLGITKFQAMRRAHTLIHLEQVAIRQATHLVVCSEADRAWLADKLDPSHVSIAPVWSNLEFNPLPVENIMAGRLVFFGAMDRIANRVAAEFLIYEVFPLVVAEYPKATLRIVGANPPVRLTRQYARHPQITLTGYVRNVAAEWATADVAVLPSLIGGGQVTKIMQAMAAGRPVVTSPFGNEGIGAPDGIAVELGVNASDFANAVLRLLRDRLHWSNIANGGREFVRQHFDWQTSVRIFEAAYQAALST